MMPESLVLIVGAGPTGLNLALALARRNVAHRIISDANGPGEQSRAMVVQARTLEFYGQYGFADEVIRQGVVVKTAHVQKPGGHEAASFSFEDLGDGISPYPFALAYAQDDHERFLVSKLESLGTRVEWAAKLTGFEETGGGINATVEQHGRVEKIGAAWICGCDGARSCVRETLGLGFPGGTYDQIFYVTDVNIARGFDRDMHFSLGEHILSLMFPVRSSGMQRLIGLVPQELAQRQDLTFEDIRGHVEPLLDIKVTEVNWFSTYRVHHRVAEKFRVGRAFLLGDAGHIHSPVGGQGMNTGIGDAVNLGWKLAQVVQGRADESLLSSYEPERIGFARLLVSTTDRAFTPIIAEGLRGELTRKVLAPLFFTVFSRFSASRHAAFRLVSQTRIHYDDSPLSEGEAGEIHGGDRLPWTGAHGTDNFALLRSLDWQAHVYGDASDGVKKACRDLDLPIHVFAWDESTKKAGLEKDALYLVRPDGYIALASSRESDGALRDYAARHQVRYGLAS
jgi:2-polyprenyl-6-methoxyphenol hydroxylase-like FAD-dependent oxidoreductase